MRVTNIRGLTSIDIPRSPKSVFLGLALVFWGSELQGKDYFITVGGGYTPQQNQASLEANVLFFQKILSCVTAHGGEGPDDNPRNTTISCWNNESITREEFTLWLDELPDHVSVVLVMAQCYCGGFADTIFWFFRMPIPRRNES